MSAFTCVLEEGIGKYGIIWYVLYRLISIHYHSDAEEDTIPFNWSGNCSVCGGTKASDWLLQKVIDITLVDRLTHELIWSNLVLYHFSQAELLVIFGTTPHVKPDKSLIKPSFEWFYVGSVVCQKKCQVAHGWKSLCSLGIVVTIDDHWRVVWDTANFVPSGKLTWQWKITIWIRKHIFKWTIPGIPIPSFKQWCFRTSNHFLQVACLQTWHDLPL